MVYQRLLFFFVDIGAVAYIGEIVVVGTVEPIEFSLAILKINYIIRKLDYLFVIDIALADDNAMLF